MKRDSQANELAEQRTLLPSEGELLAKNGRPGRRRSASQGLLVRGAFRSRVRKYPARRCQLGLTFPLVTRMFLQGQICGLRRMGSGRGLAQGRSRSGWLSSNWHVTASSSAARRM